MITASLLQESLANPDDSHPSSARNFASDAGQLRNQHRAKPDDDDSRRGPWLPVEEILVPGTSESIHNPYVRFYESGKSSLRTFCGRCGVMISYHKLSMPAGFENEPIVYDINMASLDKDDLNLDWYVLDAVGSES
jgi:hypothetical protein